MTAAPVGVVRHQDIAFVDVVCERSVHGTNRERHGTHMDRHALRLRDDPRLGIEHYRGKIARLVEQRRKTGAHHHLDHFLRDGEEFIANHPQRHRVHASCAFFDDIRLCISFHHALALC